MKLMIMIFTILFTVIINNTINSFNTITITKHFFQYYLSYCFDNI